MSTRYIVNPGRSVQHNGKSFGPRTIIPTDALSRAELLSLLEGGFIRVYNSQVMADIQAHDDARRTIGPRPKVEGKWTFDPALLEGKSLDELQIMILDRDEAAPEFATVNEAIIHLSQDFDGAPIPEAVETLG
jgi:hypothetical protein